MRPVFTVLGLAAAAAAVLGAGSPVAAAPATVMFAGFTNQDEPIIVEVSPRRTRIVRIRWDWRASCTPAPTAPPGTPTTTSWSDRTSSIAVARSGAWSSRYTAGPFTDDATGVSQTFTYRLAGRLRPDGVMTGTIRATFEEAGPAGPIRSCPSSVIRFRIRD